MQLSYPLHSQFQDHLRAASVRALLALLAMLTCSPAKCAQAAKKPDFAKVAAAAGEYFATKRDYKDGDLISQQDIAAVLKNVAAIGWEVPNEKDVVELALPDGSFLVRALATPSGKNFARKVARVAGGYPHLDRLSQIPRGEQTIRDLIRDPGGDKMIEYMATTKGGHNMSRMMAQVRDGVNLNKPTGRIYTSKELLDTLETIYKASP